MRYRLPQPFEELEHTADVGVRVRGRTPDEALARLVLAYGQLLLGSGPTSMQNEGGLSVADGEDSAVLAVNVLRELHLRFVTERVIPVECEIARLDTGGAEIVVGWTRYDREAHREGVDIKAVTYHAAAFDKDETGWYAQVIFDI